MIELKNIIKNIETDIMSNITYNERIKLIDLIPSIVYVLPEDAWDLILVNYVSHNLPQHFSAVPIKLVNAEIYKTYLMSGAKKLKSEFKPVIIESCMNIDHAIFLMKSCNTLVYKFHNHRKFKTHLLKKMKNGLELGYGQSILMYSCLDRILNNPKKYIGYNNSFDSQVIMAIFAFDYYNKSKFEKCDNAFKLMGYNFAMSKIATVFYSNSGDYLFDKYNSFSDDSKNSFIVEFLEYSGYSNARDFEMYGWSIELTKFFTLLKNKHIRLKVEFKDKSTHVFYAEDWILKYFKRLFIKRGD